MALNGLRPALVLSAWTLLVWTTRIRNIWTDEDLDTTGQLWRTALALAFTAFAVVTIVGWWRARGSGTSPAWLRAWIRAFAAWTVGVWLVRGLQITAGDHGAAFVAVHTALAVVSIALAAWAVRSVNSQARQGPSVSA